MHLHEDNLLRVLEEGLRLSGQPQLIEVADPREEARVFEVPRNLSRSWQQTLQQSGLETRLHRAVQRPITFNEGRARQQSDVVYAHLGHPLVQRAARELRGQVWTRTNQVRGISAVVVDGLDQSFAAGVARLVLVGEGGVRLHEEVFLAGTRFYRRQELGIEKAEDLLVTALDGLRISLPGPGALDRIVSHWNSDTPHEEGIRARVAGAVDRRAEKLRRDVETNLDARRESDLVAVGQIFDGFRGTLRSTLDAAEEAHRAGKEMLFQFPEEKRQREQDLARVRTRLAMLDEEQLAERASVERRYRDVQAHVFVAALVFALTPEDVEKLEAAGGR